MARRGMTGRDINARGVPTTTLPEKPARPEKPTSVLAAACDAKRPTRMNTVLTWRKRLMGYASLRCDSIYFPTEQGAMQPPHYKASRVQLEHGHHCGRVI